MEGQGAGEGPTASSVISDLIDCAIGLKLHLFSKSHSELSNNIDKISSGERPYYLRVFLKDQKGSMSSLTKFLSDSNISLDKIIQKDENTNNENKFKPVIMITYPVKKDEIDSLIDILSNSDIVSSEPLHMPILIKG